MNRNKAERWLSRAMDGELSARQRKQLDAYLLQHPELAVLRQQWAEVGELARVHQPVPEQTAEAAWQAVQRTIRAQSPPPHVTSVRGWGWAWSSAALAASLAAVVWWVATPSERGYIAEADRTEVEWVETELPDAISMVYEDAESGVTVIWVMTEQPKENEHAG